MIRRSFLLGAASAATLVLMAGVWFVLGSRSRSDSDRLLDLARGSRRAGERELASGEWARAQRAARRALGALDHVGSSFAGAPRVHRERALAHEFLAKVLLASDQNGAAEIQLKLAGGYWAQLVSADQHAADDRVGMGECLYRLGSMYRDVGRWDEAATIFRRGRALCESPPARALGDRRVDQRWVDFLDETGHILMKLGSEADALECYSSAVLAQTEVTRAHGNRAEDQERLVALMTDQADRLTARQRTGDAERMLAEAGAAADMLRTNAGAQSTHHHMAVSILIKRADLIRSNPARLSEACDLLTAARSIEQSLLARCPDDPAGIERLATIHGSLACLKRDQNQPDAALALYHDEIVLRRRLVNEQLEATGHRFGLGSALHNQADLLRERGRFDEALALEREAIDWLRRVYRENVLDRTHRTALSYACWTLCALALDKKDHREGAAAVALYQAIEPNGFEEALESARFLARCADLAAADPSLPALERSRSTRSYADQAMKALKSAVSAGFHDPVDLKTAAAYRSLRSRADFERLVREVDDRVAAAAL